MLFEELNLSQNKHFKNRTVMSPMTIESAYYDGGVTQEMIGYYALRAGDTAAIIVESAFVKDNRRAFPGALGVDSDDKIDGLSRLAKSIQAKGSKAILQLYHAGRMAQPELNGGKQPICPSSIAALRDNAVVPAEMSEEQIEEMLECFCLAAQRAVKAGFDGVEIHGANKS